MPFSRHQLPIENRWGRGAMQVLEFGPQDRPVDLVFAHANGFNARTYATLLAPLAETYRIWVPDLRGHGGTHLPTPPHRRNWDDMVGDVEALLQQIDAPSVVLAGHSMGGTTALLTAARQADRVRGLVLLDPVIWSYPFSLVMNLPILGRGAEKAPIAKAALRRRRTFSDHAEALAAYKGRGAFKGWPDGVLEDYLADGLVPDGNGGVTLACSPEWEAANYGAQANRSWLAMARYRQPIHILKADTGSTCRVSNRPRGLPQVRVDVITDSTHFMPMLKPDVARAAIEAMVD